MKDQQALVLVVLLVLIVGGYHFLQQSVLLRSGPGETADIDEAITTVQQNVPALAQEDDLREEARHYISEITEHDDDPVEVDNADHFVSSDEPIILFPDREFEIHTLKDLRDNLEPGAPLTIVREQEQVEMTSSHELLADSGGDLAVVVKVLEGGELKEKTVEDIIENHPDPASPISVIRKTESLEVTTLAELDADENLPEDRPIKVIREPYRLQTTTVAELLMGEQVVDKNAVFYVRNVIEGDVQGLWGIVHNGLVKNFASGIAIRRGQEIRNYQLDIPAGADERLADQSSSFLGQMIDRKTRESYVYNYQQGIMGKNPDLVRPGQEVVIIGFTPEELYQIYEHFVTRSESST